MKTQCLFCPADACLSRSVEHIIPESLWNHEHILPAGVVCDDCNNYFARAVEKPFLGSPIIETLRFDQWLPSKRGRIPPVRGMMLPGVDVGLRRLPAERVTLLELPDGVKVPSSGTLLFPANREQPSPRVVGRFLAKMAIEAMALRLINTEGGLQYVAAHPHLDEIRTFARRGLPATWPVHVRRIYPSNQVWRGSSGETEQVVHEFDILVTEKSEYYFVFCLFGVEFVINYGGPELEGFHDWLRRHQNISPLYSGRNASS